MPILGAILILWWALGSGPGWVALIGLLIILSGELA